MNLNNLKGTIWRYYLFGFLRDFSLFSAVLIPFYTQWGDISLTQVQILQSWFMLWIFILEIPTGIIADYLGRKYSMAMGAVVISIAALIYGSVPSFQIFLIGEFFFAMAIALMSGADSALLYDTLKQEGREDDSKKIFGRARSFTLLGIFISAPLGGFIASKLGLNSPMLFSAFPFLLAAIVAWTIKEPENKNKTSESKRYLIIAKKGLSYFQHHPTLRLLALDAIVVASAAYFVIWLYQPLLTNLNVPIYYFGWFHAFLVGIEILISSNFVRLEKLFGSGKKYFRFTAMVTALSFFLAALHPNLFTITLLIIFAGGFGLTRLDLMNAYMNKHIPSEQRATILSSISMFRRLALVFLNPIIGFTADHSLRLALLIVGLLPLTIFIFSPLRNQENI